MTNHLKIKILTEWQEHEMLLPVGAKITFGRSPDADVPVPRASVSQLHLSLFWDGTQVLIEDLGSSNGSYRMPQEAPFERAVFSGRISDLILKLSKSIVTLSWETDGQDVQALTRTIAETNKATTKTVPETRDKAVVDKQHRVTEPLIEVVRGPQATRPQSGFRQIKPLVRVEDSLSSASLGVLFVLGLLLLGVSLSFGRGLLRGFAEAPRSLMNAGGAADLFLTLVGITVRFSSELVFLIGGGIILGWIFHRLCLKGKITFLYPLADTLADLGFAPHRFLFFLAVLSYSAVWTWPFVWAVHAGMDASKILPARDFWTLQTRPQSVESKIANLVKAADAFPGSSLVYRDLLMARRAKVLNDCEGRGPRASWEQKRFCFVLMTAVAVETYGQVQPALLRDVASRSVVLFVLDGLTRVVAAEGSDSLTLQLFLGALDGVGLEAEAQDLETLLSDSTGDVESELIELRKGLEKMLELRQRQLRIPVWARISVPGPLESGL